MRFDCIGDWSESGNESEGRSEGKEMRAMVRQKRQSCRNRTRAARRGGDAAPSAASHERGGSRQKTRRWAA